jgi:SAM-dependent methyltransferase
VGRALATSFKPESYYSEDYFSGGHADGYPNYADTASVLKREFAGTVAAIRSIGPASGRLLEVGCAYGYFLEEARPYYEVHGVELADAAVADCHRRGLGSVRQGQVTPELLDEIGALDVAVMLDVIEHLPDPFAVLRLLAERLQPGGLVLITTGDFASLAARLSGALWRLMTPPQHLWFFTPAAIRRAASTIGLRAVEISHPWKFVPLSLIAYQLRRMTGRPLSTQPGGGATFGLPVNLFDAMRITLRKPG